MTDTPTESDRNIRNQAEKIAQKNAIRSLEHLAVLSPEEVQQTLHELGVHQISAPQSAL
jgi:hypothetical protein